MKGNKIFELCEGDSLCLCKDKTLNYFLNYLLILISFTLTHPFFRRISRQKSQRDREEEELKRQLSAPDKLIKDEDTAEGSVSNLTLMAAR